MHYYGDGVQVRKERKDQDYLSSSETGLYRSKVRRKSKLTQNRLANSSYRFGDAMVEIGSVAICKVIMMIFLSQVVHHRSMLLSIEKAFEAVA